MCEQGELDDTTGVELVQGRSAGCVRPMITVKEEKVCLCVGGGSLILTLKTSL